MTQEVDPSGFVADLIQELIKIAENKKIEREKRLRLNELYVRCDNILSQPYSKSQLVDGIKNAIRETPTLLYGKKGQQVRFQLSDKIHEFGNDTKGFVITAFLGDSTNQIDVFQLIQAGALSRPTTNVEREYYFYTWRSVEFIFSLKDIEIAAGLVTLIEENAKRSVINPGDSQQV